MNMILYFFDEENAESLETQSQYNIYKDDEEELMEKHFKEAIEGKGLPIEFVDGMESIRVWPQKVIKVRSMSEMIDITDNLC